MAHDLKDINEKMNILCNEYVDEKGLEPNYAKSLFDVSWLIFQYIIDVLKTKIYYEGTILRIPRIHAYPVKYVLLGLFPTSEINFKNDRDGIGDSDIGTMTLKISHSDILPFREIISEYNNYLKEKREREDKPIIINKQIKEIYEQISELHKKINMLKEKIKPDDSDPDEGNPFDEWGIYTK